MASLTGCEDPVQMETLMLLETLETVQLYIGLWATPPAESVFSRLFTRPGAVYLEQAL